jgi:hypothetical protein
MKAIVGGFISLTDSDPGLCLRQFVIVIEDMSCLYNSLKVHPDVVLLLLLPTTTSTYCTHGTKHNVISMVSWYFQHH